MFINIKIYKSSYKYNDRVIIVSEKIKIYRYIDKNN